MAARARWLPGGAGVLALAAAVALTVAGNATAQQSRDEGFDAAERRRLADGELVTRRSSRRRGQLRLIGGNAWQVVDQPVSVTWRALCDAANWHRMLPATESARIVAHRPGQRTVEIRHSVGFVTAAYHLRLVYDHDRRDISFRLDQQRDNDLRAAWGFLNVRPFDDDPNRSLVSWGVMADVGGGMIGGMMRGEVHEWMLRVPETIRTYLHGSGGRRYAD
ncbi:MAG TPA: SRPBCC family protein [Sandaracinaceae bacterium LLY-WYZ-13_1]|nr:SRPBCC family protein [Sandaracinaceae bacterium LLY-WYZ-13_1]